MANEKIKIANIEAGSIAEEVGIEAGDFLISIDGNEIVDILDYRFFCANEILELEIEKANGEEWEIEIEKEYEDDLGIEFENPMITEEKSCTNKCVFCFIDQLPKGMRETMYFKDDDSRLSFLTGNYVTLTNIKPAELDRIIRYRLSPINVSVHATNSDLRAKMLGNRFGGEILSQIRKITDAGLTVNAQVVVCPGINDGIELEKTIRELSDMHPGLNSISVVPVGLTRFRDGLPEIKPVDLKSATEILKVVEQVQKENLKTHGSHVVFAADEMYIKAGREMPEFEAYEDFPQIENGVGLVASLRQEVRECLKSMKVRPGAQRNILIATGVDAQPIIETLAREVEAKVEGLKVRVIGVKNNFFGESVTVCGLLTGRDVCEAVKSAKVSSDSEILVLCSKMFRASGNDFLDDFTIGQLEAEIGMKVLVTDNSGEQFVETVGWKEWQNQ
ncbi:MAG: DUF512 domain-containing protein [Bacillota bacterium]